MHGKSWKIGAGSKTKTDPMARSDTASWSPCAIPVAHPAVAMTKPENSSIRRSKVGEQRTNPQTLVMYEGRPGADHRMHPVQLRIAKQLAVAQGDMDPGITIHATGLDQRYADCEVLGQAGGDSRAGRACVDHDMIRGPFSRSHLFPPPKSVAMSAPIRGALRCRDKWSAQQPTAWMRKRCPAIHLT